MLASVRNALTTGVTLSTEVEEGWIQLEVKAQKENNPCWLQSPGVGVYLEPLVPEPI